MGWAAADQALWSAGNFILNIFAARFLATADFGAFSVVYLLFVVLLGVSRSIVTDPLAVRFSGSEGTDSATATSNSAGTSIALGVLSGVPLFIVASVVPSDVGAPLALLAVFLPFLLLQDCLRYSFLTQGRPRSAFINDVIFLAAEAVGLGVVAWADAGESGSVIAAWGCGAALAAGIGIVQLRTVPNPRRAGRWLVEHQDLNVRFAFEFGALAMASQTAFWTVAWSKGLEELGVLRAAFLIYGPLNTLFQGVEGAAIPEAVRARQKGIDHLWNMMLMVSAACGLMALVWMGLTLLIPRQAGTAVVGDLWDRARPLLPLVGVFNVFYGVGIGASCGLRARALAKRTLRIRMFIAILATFLGGGGAWVGGASGAMVGIAVAAGFGVVRWWREFGLVRRTESEHPRH